MKDSLKIYVLTVGVPALLLACAGVRLVQLEARHAARRDVKPPPVEMRAVRELGCGPACRPMRERRHPFPRVFREDATGDTVEYERMLWIGGCVIGLLFLSLVSGAWLLVKSERKAREDAIRKTDFLSNVSHEFKTPLTTICLCAELAQDDGMDPARRKKALQSILLEANRLKSLVVQALDFSRLERKARHFNLVRCDLGEIARESSAPFAERFPDSGLVSDGCVTACAVADVDAVRQIVAVLLDNAAKYAAKGGIVEVSSGVEKGRAFVAVADRGPGMASGSLHHAFDRFWRGDDATTAETGGSGLGLAIARELARGMGGDLSVERRTGGGLVFTLTLPAADGEATR